MSEQIFLKNAHQTANLINQLHGLGVLVALDDFGNSFPSLSHIKDFPIDSLKIHQAFIANMYSSRSKASLVQYLLDMAKKLRINIVCEGVETESQMEFLRSANFNFGQGYFFSRPVSADDFAFRFLRKAAIGSNH